MMLMRCFCVCMCVCFFAYVLGTHLNCINFKWVLTTYAFIRSRQKVHGCNLNTTELIDCVLIRVCVVIRANMVCSNFRKSLILRINVIILWQ